MVAHAAAHGQSLLGHHHALRGPLAANDTASQSHVPRHSDRHAHHARGGQRRRRHMRLLPVLLAIRQMRLGRHHACHHRPTGRRGHRKHARRASAGMHVTLALESCSGGKRRLMLLLLPVELWPLVLLLQLLLRVRRVLLRLLAKSWPRKLLHAHILRLRLLLVLGHRRHHRRRRMAGSMIPWQHIGTFLLDKVKLALKFVVSEMYCFRN